jgi:glycosyltransferase involved in cell wall biosynthesis
MRVLHIGAGNLYGGVETMLVTLARCRDLCPGMAPEFAVCFEGRLSDELRATGAPIHMLGEARIRRPDTIWRVRRRLLRVLNEREFDAVACHMAWSQVVFGPVIQSTRLPLVFWQHDATDGRHWLERWASRTRPDLALCNSRFTAASLGNLYPSVSTATIYCPVAAPRPYDDCERGGVRNEFNTSPDVVAIVQVGRLQESKGQHRLLQALGQLKSLPNWTCWLVGGAQRAHEARYLERLKRTSMQLGINDRVRFVGQRSDVGRLLLAADIFCQPNSEPEAFGIVFIEALYAGLPIVTTAMGGALEIVDNSCGVLVEAGDVSALSQALAKLVREPQMRRQLGGRGPARALTLCEPVRQLSQLFTILEARLASGATLVTGRG